MNNGYQIAGWITFSIGFLLGLVYALPSEPDVFMFGTGSILCVVGIIFIRHRDSAELRKKHAAETTDSQEVQSGDPSAPGYVFDAATSLTHLLWFVDQIKPGQSDTEIQEQIEKIQFYQVTPMIQNRYHLQDDLGIESFAHVYSFFASGERHLNRAWSAVVDGFREEAITSLANAREGFAACREALKEK